MQITPCWISQPAKPRRLRSPEAVRNPAKARNDRGGYSAYNDRCWKELERGELTKPQLVVKRYALFLEHYGIDKDPQTVNETYADCLSKTAIELPGAEDLLKRLYGKAKIYIITNGLTKVQKGRFAEPG